MPIDPEMPESPAVEMSDILDSSVGADEDDPPESPDVEAADADGDPRGTGNAFPYPRPAGRVTTVDFGKGLSMLGMVVLHYAGSGIEELGGTVSSGPGIINGVFQLMNGMFFFLSAFGNYVSIRRQLDRGASCGGAAVLLLGAAILFWGSVFLGVAVSSCGGGGPECEDWLRWAIFRSIHERPGSVDKFGTHSLKKQLFRPIVISFIAFNVMASSLIALWAEQAAAARAKRQIKLQLDRAGNSPSPHQTHAASTSSTKERKKQLFWKIKVVMAAASIMLVMGILLRIILDQATCTGSSTDGSDGTSCLGYMCETPAFNSSEVMSVPSRFPDKCYVTHAAKADFSDNKAWKPCAGLTRTLLDNSTLWSNLTGFALASNDPQTRCAAFRNLHVKKLSQVSLATMSQAGRGYRWCPTNVSGMDSAVDGRSAESEAEPCLLIPWWGPQSGTGTMHTLALWDS